MKYIVPVIYRGQDNFVVDADTPEEAREKAELLFRGGEPADECGNEWEEFDRTGTPEITE